MLAVVGWQSRGAGVPAPRVGVLGGDLPSAGGAGQDPPPRVGGNTDERRAGLEPAHRRVPDPPAAREAAEVAGEPVGECGVSPWGIGAELAGPSWIS